MSGVDTEQIAHLATNQVFRRYYQYVEREDLLQESRLWLWQHQDRVAAQEERADSEGAAANWVKADVVSHLEKLARGQKAAYSGYDASDDYFYAPGVIALVLPKVLAGDREPPQRGLDAQPSGRSDPAEGNEWLALWVDVEQALSRLGSEDLHLLVDRHFEDMTYDALAERHGWASTSTAQKYVRRAENHLIEQLGGREPKGCGPNCSHWGHDENLRRRPNGREEMA